MTPEGKVKTRIKALLKKHGAYFTMPVMTGYATNGTPDFVGCHKGRFFAVEAKAGSNTTTRLQEARLAEIQQAGGYVFVIRETNVAELEQWLEAA